MKVLPTSLATLSVIAISSYAVANDTDQFNYRSTDTTGANKDYGPEDWGKVTCSDVSTCVSTIRSRAISKLSIEGMSTRYLCEELILWEKN